jgi:adenine-specific DNA-methyltransferase
VHERIDPASILSAARKVGAGETAKSAAKDKAKGAKAAQQHAMQPGLFDAPFESLPLRDAIDFYKHDKGWSNRLVAGDSLLVMNSLLQKEGMAGQVQMIYIDPPYGIKYGSNFQPFVNKRDVKDRKDEDLTQEPEMIKAFRDTWELGIHSYLTYLRDRLLLAKELLSETAACSCRFRMRTCTMCGRSWMRCLGPRILSRNCCLPISWARLVSAYKPDVDNNGRRFSSAE